MSNDNDMMYIDANGEKKVKIDPDVLKKVFGDPKNNEMNRPNEYVGESYATANAALPLLATPNAQNDSKTDPEVDDLSKKAVPETDSGPRLPTDNLNVDTGGPKPQPSDQTLDGAANNDHFQWWSNEDDQDPGILESRFGELPPVPPNGPAAPAGTPDVNAYQQRKNLAHGMMDLALLSANATQLRTIIEASSHPYFYPGVTFISLSIIFQVTVGILLILNSRYDVTKKTQIENAILVNDITVVGVFLITIINVFIASFVGVTPAAAATAQQVG